MTPSWTSEPDSSRRTIPASVLSIVVHGSLFWAIATGAETMPPEPLSPLRFSGQTFDIDAFGDANQEDATAPSEESAPGQDVPEPEPEIEPVLEPDPAPAPDPDPEPGPAPEPETAPEPNAAGEAPDEAEASPEAGALQEAVPEPPARPSPTPQPTAPNSPIDPFDMALPGESAPGSTPSAPSDTGSYGADNEEAEVTDVYKAFLHTFPEANRHDAEWKTLPPGPVGRVEFIITIGKNARLVSIQVVQDPEFSPPPLLVKAIRKTQTFLQHQRLGWEGERRDGRQRLAVEVMVSKKAPHATTPEREGTQRHGRYGETRPTGAFFTYYDGHHIDIQLWRLPSGGPPSAE